MLSLKQVQKVCCGATGQCKYLGNALTKNNYVSVCTKLIDAKDRIKYGVSKYYSADNCQGYPLLLYTEQGYDKV